MTARSLPLVIDPLKISATGIPNDRLYVIRVVDGLDEYGFAIQKHFEYNNAVDAVNAFNKFVDIGDSTTGMRKVVLFEPNEQMHVKQFGDWDL